MTNNEGESMKKLLVAVLVLGCEAGIGPDPTSNFTSSSTSTSNGGSSSNGTGGSDGGNNQGGNNQGGNANGGGGGMPGGGYESGTRIKERYLTGADGSRVHYGWYDTEKEVECIWRPVSGGIRCIPLGLSFANYYGDAACTQRLALAQTCSQAPAYAVQITACNDDANVFPVGAQITPALFYLMSGNSCVNIAAPQGFDAYVLGAQIPDTDFVSATLNTD